MVMQERRGEERELMDDVSIHTRKKMEWKRNGRGTIVDRK